LLQRDTGKEDSMGLIEALAREFLPKLLAGGGRGQSPLVDIITSLLTNPQTGGLRGLTGSFQKQGMEDIINSWIGTGKNMPISPDQILKALGNDRLRGYSDRAGIPQDEISGDLASLLPEIIDKLTPQGRIPDSSLLEEELKEMKKKISEF
jgi:uncharacterized protein YidB (DUF937 family)